MAVIDAMSFPIINMLDKLLMRVGADDELKKEIRREFISEAIDASKEERRFGADRFKNEVLKALYGDGGEQEMRNVIARLSVGGKVTNVTLTNAERAYVASVIMNTFKEK